MFSVKRYESISKNERMDVINSVIKWAKFPEITVSSGGHSGGLILEEQRATHSSYAAEEAIVRNYGRLLGISLITGALVFGVESTVFASSLIDVKADALYKKFIKLAALIIAFKGGWDILNKALREDFDGAKKISFQYLIVFALILALPMGLRAVEGLFVE